MKWEPAAIMLTLTAVCLYIAQPVSTHHVLRPGAETAKLVIGAYKGDLETVTDAAGARTFRILPRDGAPSRILTEPVLTDTLGPDTVRQAVQPSGNALFRALNITGWPSLLWVAIGLAGQVLFAGRMFVQWVVSERKGISHIPESFWWCSLVGGAMLLIYFIWRQDPIGVIGQAPNVVIYSRNLRLIHKRRRAAADNTPSPPEPRP
ncbi:hypothetical protein BH11PLA1_BH11PLA1_02700 [soil metagenome]